MTVEFRLLGDVDAYVDGRRVDLGHARQRCVLAVLLVEPNRTVTVDRLIDRIWGEHAPHRPERTLRSYLSRLRTALAAAGEDARLVRRPGGYALAVDPSTVDVQRFRELVARARASGHDDEAMALFRAALELWRGDAFATLDSPWLGAMRDTLAAERLEAELDLTDLALRRGQPSELLATLVSRAAAHSLDERLAGQVMLAQYRAGRSADALRHYDKIRSHLAEELGTDPSPPLQRLHQQILTDDPMLTIPAPTAAPPLVPRQLPGSIPYFVGRTRELDLLTAQLEKAGPVMIVSIGGTAGVGKTTLAIHWARQVLDRFPDGQLYLNLRGFDVGGMPMTVAEAVRAFLDALGVPAARIPADPEARAALYRSIVQDRRLLIVLDNAASSEQVRPLLPGSPGCMVLVTSRQQLSGLVVRDHAAQFSLALMSTAEARELLAFLLGTQRVLAEPEAVEELIRLCVNLPLALGIAATIAIAQPDLPLRVLVAQLREERDRLTTLSTGDGPDTDLRAVFSWSYRRLSADAARLFGLLGLHPGPDIATPAAASLTGRSIADTRALLAELTRAHLLHEHVQGRYQFHDLLRVYARELPCVDDAAVARMLDHYLHTSCAAALLLQPFRDPIPLPAIRPGVAPDNLADHGAAMAWFDAECPVLRGILTYAYNRHDGHVWRLAWALTNYLDRRGHWLDLAAAHRAGLDAARRLADPLGQAFARRGLGLAYARMGRWDDAQAALSSALDQFRMLGDGVGQGHTHLDLGWVAERQGRRDDALGHGLRALELFRAAGHRSGQANARNAIGWMHAMRGDYRRALRECQQALVQFQEIGDLHGEAPAWDSIGYAHHHLRQYREAIACYEKSLELYRKLGNRYYEADILTHLGDSHAATEATFAARTAWQQALAILTDLDHPDAHQLRTKLDQLGQAASTVLNSSPQNR